MTRIYLAGPFFSERQIEIIDSVEKALAKNETITEVYSPRLHQEGTHEPLTKLWAKAHAFLLDAIVENKLP